MPASEVPEYSQQMGISENRTEGPQFTIIAASLAARVELLPQRVR
jgi:hypothetical protein